MSVNIVIENGGLGATLQTSDGIAGLVVTGVTQGSVTAGQPVLLSSLASLTALGVTEAGNAFVYKHVKEFYDEAGAGALLYLNVVTLASNIDAICTAGGAVDTLLAYANGQIKLIGAVTNDAVVYTSGNPVVVTGGINSHVFAAIGHLKTLAATYFTGHKPFRAIVGGTSYSGVPGDLTDLTQGTNNVAAVLVGDSVSGAGAAVGMALGRLAKIPVQRKVSRVRDGELTASAIYIGTDTIEASVTDVLALANKGYMTFTTFPNVSGYFFNSDATASATTDDYHFIARGRAIDKAHILAYTTFVQEVDDEVPINEDGTLDAGFCKWLSQQMENQINTSMTRNKEISSVTCKINPAQNILSTNELNVQLRIVPVGYATEINISLGFINPAL